MFFEIIAQPFVKIVENPVLAYVVAGLLTSLYYMFRDNIGLATIRERVFYSLLAWWVYSLYETYLYYQYQPGKITGPPIRVDLLIIIPILYLLTIYNLYNLLL